MPRGRGLPGGVKQWALGLGVIAAIALMTLPRWLSLSGETEREPALLQPLPAVPIRIAEDLTHSDVLPAKPGELAGCSVLLITLDTTRADRIGCYGHPSIETPALDELAHQGVLFSQVMAPTPTTLPSHASILTGLYPVGHGARANGFFRVRDECVTLAEVLSGQGYATAAFVSAWVLAARFGTNAGFSTYDDDIVTAGEAELNTGPYADESKGQRSGERTTDAALAWLQAHGRRPFLLWVHYYDPHRPYEPPSPYAEAYEHPYEGEIAYTDAQVGRLVQALDESGQADNTLVVVAGDHGEGLGQHGEWTHSFLLYESTLHVPLIMRCGTRLSQGVHVDRPASLVDVMPTVLSLLGCAAPSPMDGVDLTQPPVGERRRFAETCAIEASVASLRAIRVGPLKYIHGPIPELFDLAKDVQEDHNLLADRADAVRTLHDQLSSAFGVELDHFGPPEPTEALGSGDREMLAALGYVGGGPTAGASPDALPDPKEVMTVIARTHLATALPLQERVKELTQIVEDFPDAPMAYNDLVRAYIELKEFGRAEEVIRQGLRGAPGQPPLATQTRRYPRRSR